MGHIFHDDLLAGRTALISGGTSGINLGIARAFLILGARVAIFGRDQDKANSAAAALRAEGSQWDDRILALSADVRDMSQIQNVVKQTTDCFGQLDIVIAGAAGNFVAPAVGLSSRGFQTVVDIDLIGTYNLFRAAFDYARKPSASFIAISAEQAINPHPFQAHVCAAKAGIEMLVKVLAMEWGPAGIRVNGIMPGPIDDTEGMARLAPTQDARQALEQRIPLRRYGDKQEVADLAAFLSCSAATYITGSILPCDGGAHLAGLANTTRDALVPLPR